MKFNVFKKTEIVYKPLTYIVVVVTTIWSIICYFNLDDKADSYIPATLYAAFLFIVGIFMSYMDKKIADKIYYRSSTYINLLRIRDLLSPENLDFSTSHNARMTILAFKALSGRFDEEPIKDKRRAVLETLPLDYLIDPKQPHQTKKTQKNNFITEDGFKFTNKIYKIEKEYTDLEDKIKGEIADSFNTFLKNTLNIEKPYFFETDLFNTNYEEWCDRNVEGTNEQIEVAKDFIYKKIDSLRGKIDELEIKRIKVQKYYARCYDKLVWNINKLESIYGQQLQHLINSDNNILTELKQINLQLEEIQSIQEDDSKLSDIEESIDNTTQLLKDIQYKLVDTEDNIISAIEAINDDF